MKDFSIIVTGAADTENLDLVIQKLRDGWEILRADPIGNCVAYIFTKHETI